MHFSNSRVDRLMIGGHSKWLWFLPAVVALLLIRRFFFLQLLSAGLLFTALFMALAILIVLFVVILITLGYAFERIFIALAAATRHLRLWIPDSATLPSCSHILPRHGHKVRNEQGKLEP